MGRNTYSAGKRQREADKARKKKLKDERKRNREGSGGGIPIASIEDVQPAAMQEPIPDAPAVGTEGQPRRAGPPCRLFVGGLSWDTDQESLKAFFTEAGEVLEAIVAIDRHTGQSRGFGFVTMIDAKTANKAMRELNGLDLDGRAVRVDMATER